MKKLLLLLTCCLSAYNLSSQRSAECGVLIPTNSIVNLAANKYSGRGNPPKKKAEIKKSNSITCTLFSSSAYAYSAVSPFAKPLHFNNDLNLLTFYTNKSTTYNSNVNSNKGNIVCFYSNGTSWDSTLIYAYNKYFAACPGGDIYNPAGNTNPSNAYFVCAAPLHNDTVWLGNSYSSKPVSFPGNNTAGPDLQTVLSNTLPSANIPKHSLSYSAFSVTDNGIAHCLGEVLNDCNANTFFNYGYRGAALIKGNFTAGVFNWSGDTLIPNTKYRTDGSKYLCQQTLMAWDNSGATGYIVFYGVDAGASGTNNSFQSIIYKTTTGGSTWTKLPPACFQASGGGGGCFLGGTSLYNLEATATNSSLIKPFFSFMEGADASVDNSGNLHIFTTILSSASDHPDSLDYVFTHGSERYHFLNVAGSYPLLWDFSTTNTGYRLTLIDSMGTEGTSGMSSMPGFSVNPWSDGKGGKLSTNARLQMSRSLDGTKLFYSWTESDTTFFGDNWNVIPEVNIKGLNTQNNFVTPRINVTASSAISGGAYFHYITPVAKSLTSSDWEVPMVVSNSASYDASMPLNHYYFSGIKFNASSFTTTAPSGTCAASGLNVNEIANGHEISIYPNPASNNLTVIIPAGLQGEKATVINALSQTMYETKLNSQLSEINLSFLPEGIYFLNITTGNKTIVKKIIKQGN